MVIEEISTEIGLAFSPQTLTSLTNKLPFPSSKMKFEPWITNFWPPAYETLSAWAIDGAVVQFFVTKVGILANPWVHKIFTKYLPAGKGLELLQVLDVEFYTNGNEVDV